MMARGILDKMGLTELFRDDPNSGPLDYIGNSQAFQTGKQNFANLLKDDPNEGWSDIMEKEKAAKRKAEALAMQQSNIDAGGINPDNSFNAFQGTFPGNVNQAVVPNNQTGVPTVANLGYDYNQLSNVNTAMPRVPQDPGMSLGQAYDTYGLTGMAKGLFGFGQESGAGVPGAEGATMTDNTNISDTRQGLLNILPDGLKDSLSNFKSGYDNLSKEDAEAMISAFEQATARPEATPFSAIRPSAASAGYRIPVENLYNRGLLKI
tara:strand:- start:170 stop:961 length:792 start_codon:yes stop_codon:yes gene_type:complete